MNLNIDSLFKPINDFNNTSDYLAILNGCINTDLMFIFLVSHGLIKSVYLKKWYKEFNLSAVLLEIIVLFIIIIITRYVYTYFFKVYNIFYFISVAVVVFIFHDFSFYTLFSRSPMGYNYMLDFFKGYSNELGFYAIFNDICVIIIACLLSMHFNTYNLNTNIIFLVLSCYFYPFMIYYE